MSKSPLTPTAAGGRKVGRKNLTAQQKAEAAALWRSGEITLAGLAEKFGKRPETFSRLFKDMGIEKGEAAAEHQAKVAQAVEAKLLSDAEVTAQRIAQVKEQHFKYADGIAKLVWAELVKARQGNKEIGTLKETMQTLQLAASTIGKAREELYALLQVEKHDNLIEEDDLPELMVRELTQEEVDNLRGATAGDELDVGGEGDIEEGIEELPEPASDDPQGQST